MEKQKFAEGTTVAITNGLYKGVIGTTKEYNDEYKEYEIIAINETEHAVPGDALIVRESSLAISESPTEEEQDIFDIPFTQPPTDELIKVLGLKGQGELDALEYYASLTIDKANMLPQYIPLVLAAREALRVRAAYEKARPVHFLVGDMHKKFGIEHTEAIPVLLTQAETKFRVDALKEEADELAKAKTAADQADALIDAIVFALGGLEKLGVLDKFEAMFCEVMRANMDKEVVKDASESKRGYKLDLKKPDGWTPPNLKKIIGKYYKRGPGGRLVITSE